MAFMSCKLGSPTTIVGDATDVNAETYPSSAKVTFQFPARGSMPALAFNWYEGRRDGKKVLPPDDLLEKATKNKIKITESGSLLVGGKGMLFSPSDYGSDSYIITDDGAEKLTGKPERLPSNNGNDQGMKDEWLAAIKAGKPDLALSNFDYAASLTETILLGNIAIKLSGRKLTWNAADLTFKGDEIATKLVSKEYRKGWELGYGKV
jgi:hypothetical protein